MNALPRLSRVAVCGGTHGNELSGVYLVRELLKVKKKKKKEEEDEDGGAMSVLLVLSNPRAMQQCLRYIDTDLNRCFTHACLIGPTLDKTPYEMRRARELNAMLGPKGSAGAMDLICDLHNTTANMGLSLITYSDHDWICMHIFRHLQAQHLLLKNVFFYIYIIENISMEVGPQPHGVVRSNIYTTMKSGVQYMLDWVHFFNSGVIFDGGFMDVFTVVKHIDYPRDGETHNITAAIHPQLQDRDFCLLRPGDPLFQTFSGETLRYTGSEPLYPFFINESAYYEKGILFLGSQTNACVCSHTYLGAQLSVHCRSTKAQSYIC
uniref:N-acyl-aromatic-L-amino acid amidohydrolase n=1 Tax=Sphaeramia orbicularis TaxID=375764 RepID=A0A673CZ11_9TELE